MNLKRGILMLCACGFATSAASQDATPNHVFQTTETVRLQLAAYNSANFTTPTETIIPSQGILPRHVLQKAEYVMEKVQLLRYMNGLTTSSLPPQPIVDVKPADVNKMVKRIEEQVAELSTAYAVELVDPSSLPSGKKPADVYANLHRLSESLDSLGVPATMPNNVYRAAQSVRAALADIARSEGALIGEIEVLADSPKTPADAYQTGILLLSDLAALASVDRRFMVPGGINLPEEKQESISPADVNALILRALADVDAIKFSIGLSNPTVKPPLEGGKTPTDVWIALEKCRAIVAALRQAS